MAPPSSTPAPSHANASAALDHYAENMQGQLQDLCALVRTPSVSFDGFDPEHVKDSAHQVARLLRDRGYQEARVLPFGDAHPYVVGSYHVSDDRPTLLLYAHHDVQPPGDVSLWRTPPFEPTERDGRLYGRGTADDKAGIAVHAQALHSYLCSGTVPPVNLKIIIEGEEETGSAHLEAFIGAHQAMFAAQAMVLTDTANIDTGVPSITTSLRGLVVFDVEVRTIPQALHSGMWGGPVPDAAGALAKILARLTDDQGRVTLPKLVGAHPVPTPAERAADASLGYSEQEFRAQAGLLEGVQVLGQHGPCHALWREASLSINCIEASRAQDTRNILVDRAWARVGLRLGPTMDAQAAAQSLQTALTAQAPWGAQVRVRRDTVNGGWQTQTEHKAFAACARALAQGYGRPSVTIGCGGSIPFVKPMCRALGDIPALLVGVEDPYTLAHAENESLHLGDFQAATRSALCLYAELAQEL